MNDTSLAAEASVVAGAPGLSRGLRSRHVTMISIGGIIGAGLFVGSSAAIAAIGPAVIVSYLLAGIVILFVMRMLAEMVMAAPDVGLLHGVRAAGPRALGRLSQRLALLVFLGRGRRNRGHRGREDPA